MNKSLTSNICSCYELDHFFVLQPLSGIVKASAASSQSPFLYLPPPFLFLEELLHGGHPLLGGLLGDEEVPDEGQVGVEAVHLPEVHGAVAEAGLDALFEALNHVRPGTRTEKGEVEGGINEVTEGDPNKFIFLVR